ncbi:MAG: hypothetical protein QXE12_00020, partial [Conexivisphaerales archaeon]
FTIPFSIPSTVSVGYHSYSIVWVDSGILLGSVTLDTSSLYVHDAYEKVFDQLYSSLQSQINSASYTSPTAQSYYSQAVSYFNQGVTLANQGQYQSAVNDLNQAQSYLSQANAAEQAYLASQAQTSSSGSSQATSQGQGGNSSAPKSNLLLDVIVIAGLLVVAVLLVNAAIRRKPKAQASQQNA